jgi:hypothetical protein
MQKDPNEQGFSDLSNNKEFSLYLKRIQEKSRMSSKEETKQSFAVFSKIRRKKEKFNKEHLNGERQ